VTPFSGRGIGKWIGAGGTAAADRAQDFRSIVGDDSVEDRYRGRQAGELPAESLAVSLAVDVLERQKANEIGHKLLCATVVYHERGYKRV
jgi:hypothetical protein